MVIDAPADHVSSRVQRKREKKHREILRIATEVLTERGYSGTSLEEIAERLDVAKATLYHYFESKDALISACLKQPSLEAMERLEATAASYGDPEKRLRAIVRENLIIVVIDYRHTSRVIMHPLELPEPLRSEYRALRARHDRLFRAAIQAGIDSGAFDPVDPLVARHCMYGAMNHASVWVHGSPAAVRRTIDAITRNIMRLFRTD